MPLDVRRDERALRLHAQTPGAHVVQGPADKLRGDPLALEGRIGLGVGEHHEPVPRDDAANAAARPSTDPTYRWCGSSWASLTERPSLVVAVTALLPDASVDPLA